MYVEIILSRDQAGTSKKILSDRINSRVKTLSRESHTTKAAALIPEAM
jgi:hypothetical protein